MSFGSPCLINKHNHSRLQLKKPVSRFCSFSAPWWMSPLYQPTSIFRLCPCWPKIFSVMQGWQSLASLSAFAVHNWFADLLASGYNTMTERRLKKKFVQIDIFISQSANLNTSFILIPLLNVRNNIGSSLIYPILPTSKAGVISNTFWYNFSRWLQKFMSTADIWY